MFSKEKKLLHTSPMIHSFTGQLIGTDEEFCQRNFSAQREHTLYPTPRNDILCSGRFKLADEDLITTLSPAPKQGAAHKNRCRISKFQCHFHAFPIQVPGVRTATCSGLTMSWDSIHSFTFIYHFTNASAHITSFHASL